MANAKILQHLLKRHRPPGDLLFAAVFFTLSIALLSQLGEQVQWGNKKLYAQPGFWSGLSLIGMCLFGGLHLLGSVLSEKNYGRWEEAAFWLRGLEYAGWFMLYVLLVPKLGYLPTTLIFMPLLSFRAGYRQPRHLWGAAGIGLGIVLLFKTLLSVKIPGGEIYEMLPDGLRSFMLLYF